MLCEKIKNTKLLITKKKVGGMDGEKGMYDGERWVGGWMEREGWTERDGWVDGWVVGWMDGWMDGERGMAG